MLSIFRLTSCRPSGIKPLWWKASASDGHVWFFRQETPVLGSVGFFSYPLPGHRLLDNGIRGQPELHSSASPSLKPALHPVQLLHPLHPAPGADEKQQVTSLWFNTERFTEERQTRKDLIDWKQKIIIWAKKIYFTDPTGRLNTEGGIPTWRWKQVTESH